MQLNELKERLLWKKTTEQIGDGGPYRTSFVEHRKPTILSRIIADSRVRMAALGIITTFAAAKVGDKMAKARVNTVNYPVPELTTYQEGEILAPYMMVGPVKMNVSDASCQSPVSECYIDLGNGPQKYKPKADPSKILNKIK